MLQNDSNSTNLPNNQNLPINFNKSSSEGIQGVEHAHCLTCIQSDCSYNLCTVNRCNFCSVNLHICKLEDHLLICLRAPTRCPNLVYGCQAKLRRDHISEHLLHCPCSVVVCSCVWCRNYIDNKAKKCLKLQAKGFRKQSQEELSPRSEALDVKMALIDQSHLRKFFQCSRACRSKNSSGLNAGILKKTDFLDKFSESDSSEEELKETARKLQKKREPFSGCYLCRRDPGSQHLHVLGNSLLEIEASTSQLKNCDRNESMPPFFAQHSLYVNNHIDYFGHISVCVSAQQGTKCQVLCNQTIRRDEFDSHHLYHSYMQECLDQFVQRCPLWIYGCQFYDCSLRPAHQTVSYNHFLRMCVHQPVINQKMSSSSLNFDELPQEQLLTILEPYLESATLKCLAATNSDVRDIMLANMAHRCAIELIWRRNQDGRWVEDGLSQTFTAVQSPTKWVLQTPSTLYNHLKECPYRVFHDFEGVDRVNLVEYYGSLPQPADRDSLRRS